MGSYGDVLQSERSGEQSTLYGRFKSHFSEKRYHTSLSIMEALRDLHPNKHITSVELKTADFLEFAEAGKAEARLVRDGDEFLSTRLYVPPTGRMDGNDGKLSENIQFGLHHYTHNGNDFLIYVVEWQESECNTMALQYVLSPKEEAGPDGHHAAVDDLIKAAGKYSSELHEEIYIFDGGFWQKSSKLWKAVQSSFWEDVILDRTMKDTLIRDVEGFFDSRATYEEYGVPWKRGVIFHGTPGCGKTISIKALMNSLQKRDVASLYVKSFKAQKGMQYSIRNIFYQARLMAPCMLIFEDLDSLVVDEVRSYFLNEMDGLEDNNGMLIIGSTNHLDRLDPSISKRPSRFDRKYHYKLPGEKERITYCQYWSQKLQKRSKIVLSEEICNVVAQLTEGFSFAYLKELFVQTLLAMVGGRAEADEEEDDGYITVTDVAKDTKVVDDSAKLIKEDETNTSTEGEKKDEKLMVEKPKLKMPDVAIPEHLQSEPLMKILHKQCKALWREMDNTEDDEIHGRAKLSD